MLSTTRRRRASKVTLQRLDRRDVKCEFNAPNFAALVGGWVSLGVRQSKRLGSSNMSGVEPSFERPRVCHKLSIRRLFRSKDRLAYHPMTIM